MYLKKKNKKISNNYKFRSNIDDGLLNKYFNFEI